MVLDLPQKTWRIANINAGSLKNKLHENINVPAALQTCRPICKPQGLKHMGAAIPAIMFLEGLGISLRLIPIPSKITFPSKSAQTW